MSANNQNFYKPPQMRVRMPKPVEPIEITAQEFAAKVAQARAMFHTAIIGYDHVFTALMRSLIVPSGWGHLLLEGVPGVGKTSVIRAIAELVANAINGRIDGDPDLRAADIRGYWRWNQATQRLEMNYGGLVGVHLLHFDEANRAPTGTQSAFLQAMAEGRVAIGKTVFMLPKPFVLLATQNPLDGEGTYPLSKAQLDRFSGVLQIDYLSAEQELAMLQLDRQKLQPVIELGEFVYLQERVEKMARQAPVSVLEYCIRLVRTTRPSKDPNSEFRRYLGGRSAVKTGGTIADEWEPMLVAGGGPRPELGLMLVGAANALMNGREAVSHDDIKELWQLMMGHRMFLNPIARARGMTAQKFLSIVLESVPLHRS